MTLVHRCLRLVEVMTRNTTLMQAASRTIANGLADPNSNFFLALKHSDFANPKYTFIVQDNTSTKTLLTVVVTPGW